MKKRFLSMLLCLCMVLSLLPVSADAQGTVNATAWTRPTSLPDGKFSGGSGTESDPYRISTPQDLADLSYIVDNTGNEEDQTNASTYHYYVMTNDIDLNPSLIVNSDGTYQGTATVWDAIGEAHAVAGSDVLIDYQVNGFHGTFDGAGHTVRGIYGQALFKMVYNYSSGTVKNVVVANSYIDKQMGALVEYLCNGTIENCVISDDVVVAYSAMYEGGICGMSYNGKIKNCSNAGRITGARYGGGICGYATVASISNPNPYNVNIATLVTNCYNSGTVEGNYAGGIVGLAERIVVEDCGTLTGIPVGFLDGRYLSSHYQSYTPEYTRGYAERCYTLTKGQVRSGEAAYILNGGQEGIWKQTLSDPNAEPSPISGGTLYLVDAYDCPNATTKASKWYSNSQSATNVHVPYHTGDENGICEFCNNGFEKPESDNGTYKVSNAGQLGWVSETVNSEKTDCLVRLTADIVIPQGMSWTPIGNSLYPFSGSFDGKNFTISGLNGMLFGTTNKAIITNFALEGGSFSGNTAASDTGSVIGNMQGGKLEMVSSRNVFSGSQTGSLGGLVGRSSGNIWYCFYNGGLEGATGTVGGLVGTAEDSATIRIGYVNLTSGTVSGAVIGSGSAEINNIYYNNETVGGTTTGSEVGKPADAFTSGEVTWYLNGQINTDGNRSWGQTVRADNSDAMPCLCSSSRKCIKRAPKST